VAVALASERALATAVAVGRARVLTGVVADVLAQLGAPLDAVLLGALIPR